jgi:hypothetical protein
MMEKSALAGEGGGCTPTPFHSVTITYKVAVYAPAERADKPPLFHLYPICTLCFEHCMRITDTEYTQRGNGRFHDGKNRPGWQRWATFSFF